MGKQKKVWSQLQDQLLKRFYEQQQMRNWSLIAKRMSQEYNTPKKSGKQCRERYENHIDSSVIKIEWTKDEEKELINLHNQIGNKWANIALNLPGKYVYFHNIRSDNCVKNHFYSKLRKVLRKLNKVIHHHFRREFRQININVIYKLVEATQQRFKQKPNCSQQVSLKCREIQNRMLQVAIDQNDEDQSEENGEEDVEMLREIVKEIYAASREYKRKSKKSRNLSIQAPNVKKHKQTKAKTIVVRASNNSKAPSDGYMSDSQHGSLQQEEQQSASKLQQEDFHKVTLPPHSFIVNQQLPKHPFTPHEKKIQIQQGKQGIQNMLRQNNILQNDCTSNHNFHQNSMFRFSQKGSFRSYNNSDRESDRDFFNVCNLFSSYRLVESSDAQNGNRRKNSKFLYFSHKADDNKSVCFSEKE